MSDFPSIAAPSVYGVKAPLTLMLCHVCKLVQLKHTVDRDLIYRGNYWYKSSVNQTMRTALVEIAQTAQGLVGLKEGDLVVDIGCNDGTLLNSYTLPLHKVGFEPCPDLAAEARGYDGDDPSLEIITDYFPSKLTRLNHGFIPRYNQGAKVITAIAMFYDLEDPNAFLEEIKKWLADDGLFIIQQNYLGSMIRQNAFDNIGHEHLEYYSLTSLHNLMERHDLEIFGCEYNNINGGSFRTYIQREGGDLDGGMIHIEKESIPLAQDLQEEAPLCDPLTYESFSFRVNEIIDKLSSFISREAYGGAKVFVYGASNRGSTILQALEDPIAEVIPYAADRNPMKFGKKMVGVNIPIISEEEARAMHPDYFFVLPYSFIDEFVRRERAFLAHGGKFLVPLPEPHLLWSPSGNPDLVRRDVLD